MIAVLAALVALNGPSPSQTYSRADCSLRQLSFCKTTNDLVWAKDFERGMKQFAGGARTDFLSGQRADPLWEDLMNTLGGPPDEPITLPDGNYLFTACVAHSCPEKGAVVITPAGIIVAAAMLTNHYVNERNPKEDLGDSYARLDYFVRSPITGEPVWYGPILDWAKSAYADGRDVMGKYDHSLGLTASVWLISPAKKELIRLRSAEIIGAEPKQGN